MSGAVLITGGAGGMGRACARALAGRGSELVLCDVSAGALEEAARALKDEGIAATPVVADLTEPAAVADLVERARAAGGLAALAHTAGLSPACGDARLIFEVNLVSSARLASALLPAVSAGSVAVMISSQAGHMGAASITPEIAAILDDPTADGAWERLVACAGPLAGPGGAYALTKRAVQRLVVASAPAWGARGGRIVSLSPGVVETQMGHAEHASNPGAVDTILEKTPVGGRMGRPEEIASVVAFLCSEGASYVSGVDWLVDGGSTHQVMGGT